jgi:hypothetical protein
MKLRLIKQRDFVAGLLFGIAGLVSAFGSTAYSLGTAMRMGPGYFPLVLGVLLAGLGLVLMVRSLKLDFAGNESLLIEKPCLRSISLIGAGMLIFAFSLNAVGLLLSTIGLVVISGIAYRQFRWHELGLLSTGLAIFAVVVFVYGLGLPFQVLPA